MKPSRYLQVERCWHRSWCSGCRTIRGELRRLLDRQGREHEVRACYEASGAGHVLEWWGVGVTSGWWARSCVSARRRIRDSCQVSILVDSLVLPGPPAESDRRRCNVGCVLGADIRSRGGKGEAGGGSVVFDVLGSVDAR